jgi:FtsP/CotA-like multicopper oxidase with cupredoxin domain
MQDGVLRLDFTATLAMWYPDGDSRPGIAVEAFGETGQPPMVPGPLVRATLGIEIIMTVRNALTRDTITYSVDVGDAHDSVVVGPGATGTMRVRPARAGTFLYRAMTSTPLARSLGVGGLLGGAVVIDSANAASPPNDRVFVLQAATDGQIANIGIPMYPRTVWAMNGRAWPNTERLAATVGDSVHWRIVNIGKDGHPMHLHGFYFSVDAVDGATNSLRNMEPPTAKVVTARLVGFTTMAMTWVPERAGNWLFHCHFAEHVAPHGALGGESPGPGVERIGVWPAGTRHADAADHASTGMAGLVAGIVVKERKGTRVAATPAPRRTLRLVAVKDAGFADSEPSLRYVLANPGQRRVEAWPGMSVPLSLIRGEPVAITIVNTTTEATSVHWHGIELDSYSDGVAGFSGSGTKLSPLIAPGDSFVARFSPPRAGTFMYHSHVDEPRQHRAGLVGPLIVREPAADSALDVALLFKIARAHPSPIRGAVSPPFETNGKVDPDTLRLRVGRAYRLRLMALQSEYPAIEATITARADSSYTNPQDRQLEQWTPLAKDGADLPAGAPGIRSARDARQLMSMGETYDFEFTPRRAGNLRLELRVGGRLASRTPIRVDQP